MSKAQELWIYHNKDGTSDVYSAKCDYRDDGIHTIEHSAYQSAVDMIGKMEKALELECGNRCAEQNPCNAKDALAELAAWKKENLE